MSQISGNISVPAAVIPELINIGDGDAALLYLHMLADGGKRTPQQAAPELRWSRERASAAFEKLTTHGLVPAQKSAEKDGGSTAKHVAGPGADEKQFYELVQEVQRLFGRILSSDELVRLFGIYDSLGLPPEVILQLVVYCAAETSGRSGTSSPPSMKYIEKAAYTWEREGVLTLEQAESYIKERSEKKRESSKIKALLQIEGRHFTPTERKYVEGWLAMGFGADVIAIAYDRTVTKTGKLSWNYMNSIITSWHGKGLFTADDIAAKDRRSDSSPRRRAGGSKAPDESELDRINRILSSLNEENRDVT